MQAINPEIIRYLPAAISHLHNKRPSMEQQHEHDALFFFSPKDRRQWAVLQAPYFLPGWLDVLPNIPSNYWMTDSDVCFILFVQDPFRLPNNVQVVQDPFHLPNKVVEKY